MDTILEPINNIILGSVNRTENGDIILTNNFVDWNEGLVDKIDGYYKKIVSNNEVVDSTEEVEGLITKVGDLRTEANAALALYIAEKVYVAGRWVQAKASASGYFGNKLPAIASVPDTDTNTFTGDSLYEIIKELNNMADIYRYDKLTNNAGIYNDPETNFKLTINGNLKTKGNISFYKKGTTTNETYSLQDLVFIESLETNILELTNNKLELRTKTNGGIEKDTAGLYIKVFSGDLEIDASGLKLKDNVYQKNITIANTTSTSIINSTIALSSGNVLTFTEGSLAKSYRDQAENFKQYAEAYANGTGTGAAISIVVGAKQYKEQAEGFKNTTEGYKNTTEGYKNTTEGYKNDANTYAYGSGSLSAATPPVLDADGDVSFTGTQGAKQYQIKAQAASVRAAASAVTAGGSASASGVSATASAASATTAALFAAISTGSAGVSALITLGNALVSAGGEIEILSFPIKPPLQVQDEAIGLSINKYELNTNIAGYLELNDTYTSLIDWQRPVYIDTLLKINLEAVSGVGIIDTISSHTILGGTLFKDRLVGVLLNTNKNIVLFENKGADTNAGNYLDRFLYDSTTLFTDHTQLSISFYSKITEAQLNRSGLLVSNEEVVFHTNTTNSQSSSSDNNGINIKFETSRTGPTRVRIYVKYQTSGGVVEKNIYSNWDNIGYLELDDASIKDIEHHYIFTFSLQHIKVYFDKVLIATHTLVFSDTNQSMINLQNHIFGGYNQGYTGLVASDYTRQYWQGTISSINVYNSVLTQENINTLLTELEYIGDKKIFADKIKLSGDFTFNTNKELKLNTTFLSTKTTNDIIEGSTNKYYTDARFDTRFATKNTDNITEGSTNKYYTDTRFDTRFGTKNTDNITEGSTNKYYTDTRFDTRLTSKTTNNITEGTTNLYYTDARVNTLLNNYVSDAELSTCNYLTLTNIPLSTSTTSGILKVDNIITTTTNNVLKLVEPASYTMTNQETVSRSYPPTRNFTGVSGTATAISGQLYGNGTYTIKFSTYSQTQYYPSHCFRTTDVIGGSFGYNQYYTAGAYTGSKVLVTGYPGDWITIEMPYAIKLKSYKLQLYTTNSAFITAPRDFKIYASNDGITWVTIDTITSCTYIDITTQKYFDKAVTVSVYYKHFGLAINRISPTGTQCQLNELYFYGVEPVPDYHYKRDAFLKYTAGVQVEATRNTGTWGITDYVSGTQVSTATSVSLGVVKGGGNVSVATDGTMSVVIPTATIATISTLGVVKSGGNVNIATDGSMSVTIPTATIATSSTIGIVKGGGNVSIAVDGSMSVVHPVLPLIATSSVAGIVKTGTGNVSISADGSMSVVHPVLPLIATSSVAGLVKTGTGNVSISADGSMSVVHPVLPVIATSSVAGLCKGGGNVSISSTGVLSVQFPIIQVIDIATNEIAGLCRGGGNIAISSTGLLNAPIASSITLGIVKQGTNITIDNLGVISAVIPNNYITNTNLTSTLNAYITDTQLSQLNYLKIADLGYELTTFSFINTTTLTSTLVPYLKIADLETSLNNYVSDTELSTYNYTTLANIPKGTNSIYGLCKGGTNVDVIDGVINLSIPAGYLLQTDLDTQLTTYTPLTTYNDYINPAVGNTYFIEITWIYADGSFKFSGSDRNTTYTDFLVNSNKGLSYNLNDVVKIITISANQTGSTYYTPRVSMWMTNSMLPHNQIDNGSYTGGSQTNPDANYWIVNHLSEQVIYTYQGDERFNQILTYGNDAGGRLKYIKINTATATQTIKNKRADFYTRAEIDKKDYIIPNTISKYAITSSALTTALTPYALLTNLTPYATIASLSDYATNANLINNYVSDTELGTCNYFKTAIATASTTGLVRGGNNISIDGTGILTANIPIASTTLGLVKNGGNVTINSTGLMNVTHPTLPVIGTASVAGLVLSGTNVTIDGSGLMTPTTATSSVKGICRPDNSSVIINNGVLSVGSVVQAWKPNNNGIYYNEIPAPAIGTPPTVNVIIGSQNNSSTDANTPIILPDAKLYVRDDKPTTNILFRGGTVGATNGKVRIYMTTDSSYSSYIESEHIGGGQTKLSLATSYSGAITTQMVITPEGTVGINSIYPNVSYKLDVNGGIKSPSLNTGSLNCNTFTIQGSPATLNSFSGNINRSRVDELYLAINERFAFVVPASIQYNYGPTLKESVFRIPVNLHLNRYNNYGNYQTTGSGISAQYYMSLQPNSVFGRFQHYFGLVRMAWIDGDSLATGNSLSHYELLSNNTNDWDTTTWGGYSVNGVFYIQVSVYTSAILNELNVILH